MTYTSISHNIKKEDAVADRYILILNDGCPFVNRVTIARNKKGLQDAIKILNSHFEFNQDGLWQFNGLDGTDLDPNGFKTVKEYYTLSDPEYVGKFTVPVLYDTKTKKIVSNESSDIITIFNTQFNDIAKNPSLNLRPDHLANQIDEFVDYYSKNLFFKVYQALNPEKYSEVFDSVFETLDKLDNLLKESKTKYLFSDEITEADIKLFVVLIRFDVAMGPIFKLNLKQIRDYPNLNKYVCRLYQDELIKPTVNFDYIKGMYYKSNYNPDKSKIVSKGPSMDYLNKPIVD